MDNNKLMDEFLDSVHFDKTKDWRKTPETAVDPEEKKTEPPKKTHAGRETGQGAGMIVYCDETGRFLLVKRSPTCDYPGTWCGLGGGVEDGEGLSEAVRREAFEEAQFPEDAPCDLHYIGCQESPGFEFHNYLGVVPEEFDPVLNNEHTEHQWCEWSDFPEEMHPCMMDALNSDEGQAVLEKHAGIRNQAV